MPQWIGLAEQAPGCWRSNDMKTAAMIAISAKWTSEAEDGAGGAHVGRGGKGPGGDAAQHVRDLAAEAQRQDHREQYVERAGDQRGAMAIGLSMSFPPRLRGKAPSRAGVEVAASAASAPISLGKKPSCAARRSARAMDGRLRHLKTALAAGLADDATAKPIASARRAMYRQSSVVVTT